ncbi:MAG: CRISPR-associated endonuclease Cas1 [Halanaerobiales bacterium]|nr:CRISPR-associated endonuclease Cas1 [Halanaerobiales bacterium]
MELIIDTYGTYLKRDQGCFLLQCKDKKQKVSTRNIDSILISTGAAISSDAIQLALERNIEIYFLDGYGDPVGKIWHSKLGKTTYVRRCQLQISEDERGTDLVKSLLLQKADNCINHLKDLGVKRGLEKKKYIEKVVIEITEARNKIDKVIGKVEDVRNTLMGYEGNIAKKYFNVLSFLLPDRYNFEGRSSRPAKDEFNCFLNYGYGVLYSKVEKACIIAGLDPYIGILHTDGYNKKSFVFDIIELFRIHVDRLVMKLFAAKTVKKSYFDKVQGGLTLNKDGKRYFKENLNNYFDKRIRFRNRDIKIADVIQFECHRIANSLIGEE